jgi:hypothetical protein
LFAPRPAYRAGRGRGFGPRGPLDGVVVDYALSGTSGQPINIDFLNAKGSVIKSFTSAAKEGSSNRAMGTRGSVPRGGNENVVRAEPGLNRFVWDMRYPDAEGLDGGTFFLGGSLRGPEAAPGHYTVRITAGDQTQTQAFEIKKDPRLPTTEADYQKQLAFLLAARGKLSQADDAINKIHRVQQQLGSVLQNGKAEASLIDSGHKLNAALTEEVDQLYQPQFTGFDDQTLIFPLKLNNRLASLQSYGQGDYAPTDQDLAVLSELSAELDKTLDKLKRTLDVDLPALNNRLKAAGLPEVKAAPVVQAYSRD